MLPDRFLHLLTKRLSASLTAEEEAELQRWLDVPEHAAQYALLKRFWQEKEAKRPPDVEAALEKVLNTINEAEEPLPVTEPRAGKRRWTLWLAAASVALLAGLGYFILQPANKKPQATAEAAGNAAPKNAWVEKQNAKGTRSVITLVDGSKVWLNADSRLQYPAAFGGGTREVSLVGEAFFDVTRDPQKPFIIHLEKGTVKVLGTSFNVKAYPGDKAVETSVSTGRVAFIPKAKNADTTFLTKNKKAVYRVAEEKVTTTDSGIEDKAWVAGELVFRATPMEDIAVQLERYFGKPVVILDDEIRGYRLTGSFANNTIEEILYYLSKTKPFTYRITDSQILLSLVR